MKVKVKVKGNPYAICRSMQKKKGWRKAKYEKCVKAVKLAKRK